MRRGPAGRGEDFSRRRKLARPPAAVGTDAAARVLKGSGDVQLAFAGVQPPLTQSAAAESEANGSAVVQLDATGPVPGASAPAAVYACPSGPWLRCRAPAGCCRPRGAAGGSAAVRERRVPATHRGEWVGRAWDLLPARPSGGGSPAAGKTRVHPELGATCSCCGSGPTRRGGQPAAVRRMSTRCSAPPVVRPPVVPPPVRPGTQPDARCATNRDIRSRAAAGSPVPPVAGGSQPPFTHVHPGAGAALVQPPGSGLRPGTQPPLTQVPPPMGTRTGSGVVHPRVGVGVGGGAGAPGEPLRSSTWR